MTLTEAHLNRALLARQLLLERADVSVPAALEHIAGIQNQYAPNGYLRLWSCLSGFARDDLTAALEARTVIQATLLRSTIHLVARDDYWPFVHAIRESRKEWWLRTVKPARTAKQMEDVAAGLRDVLSSGPRPQRELSHLVERGWGMAGPWLDLVRVPPPGTWDRRRADLYRLASDWVGPEPRYDPDAAVDHLVRRYLAGFGPSTPDDIYKFTGIPKSGLVSTLERLDLRRFEDAQGNELLDVPDGALPDPGTAAPVRFLPTWDAVLLVHARRTGVLPEDHRSRIFHTKAPQSYATFLVNGQVAGTWKYTDHRIELEPFGRLPKVVRKDLEAEADRLGVFHR